MTNWSGGLGAAEDALWVEQAGVNEGDNWLPLSHGELHVRHPGHGWCAGMNPALNLDKQAQAAATGYLHALAEWVPVLRHAVQALEYGQGGFGWLPIGWGLTAALPTDANPNVSFLLTRGDPNDWQEASLVLLAARRLNGKAMGDAVGLRVTAHVTRRDAKAPWQVRFASLAASRLDQVAVALPAGLATALGASRAPGLRQAMRAALAVNHVAVLAVHSAAADDDTCELHGMGLRTRETVPADPPGTVPRSRVYGFSVRLNLKTHAVQALNLEAMEARMSPPGSPKGTYRKAQPVSTPVSTLRLFERDPASMGTGTGFDRRRPGQRSAELDAYREYVVAVPYVIAPVNTVSLKQPDAWFWVTHESTSVTHKRGAARVAADKKTALLPLPTPAQRDPLQVLPLRSDDLAAAQAYLRAKELFDRFDAYGFNVSHYFRHAQLPLELRPRARLLGAFDGRTVNAEVRPYFRGTVPEVDVLSQAPVGETNSGKNTPLFAANQRPKLLVRLGSADTHVRRGAQALGLAADPRWAWHEFGHVLNFAATGELEFAFAHSAGDALAAITADPDSGLAADDALRGHTFPWAYVPRQHDRQAGQGYCWCGARSQLRLNPAPAWRHYRHGYFEEQLLASSLFRLYRCLGGDTGHMPEPPEPPESIVLTPAQQADLDCRRSASDYCVYLIMRAIGLLGPNGVAAARSVGQFVGAMIDADLGTGPWLIYAPWPYRNGTLRTVSRRGARVHKVIRWAFEQQGWYAAQTPGAAVEGPGQAPPVDVFIASRRSAPAGGYESVPLRWHEHGMGGWYAHPGAISRRGAGQLQVQVSQRGLRQARDATLRVWVCAASGQPLNWERVVAQPDKRVVGLFTATMPLHAQWVLACVDCAADPSNLAADVASPPTDPADLMELVAHDNNLALAYLP